MMRQDSFDILFVCTANLCRSQLAEAQLRRHARASQVLQVSSAGTRAESGAHIPARFHGLFDWHVAQTMTATRLTTEMLESADLVLTMTRDQRAEVVQVLPRSVQYTYPIVQFVELAERAVRTRKRLPGTQESADDYRLVMEDVRALRGPTRGGRQSADIPDPARAGTKQLRTATADITAYIERLARVLPIRIATEQAVRHGAEVLPQVVAAS